MWFSKSQRPWKVKIIGYNKWHHQIPWPQKHRSRRQIHHLSSKVTVRDIFLHNGWTWFTRILLISKQVRNLYKWTSIRKWQIEYLQWMVNTHSQKINITDSRQSCISFGIIDKSECFSYNNHHKQVKFETMLLTNVTVCSCPSSGTGACVAINVIITCSSIHTGTWCTFINV